MKSVSKGGLVVLAVVVGAAAFGLFLGYLAYTNDSFPAQQRPFGDYASVVYSSFNGTELAFRVQWLNSGYVPLYAQLTSQSTDAANTPVCSIGLSAAQSGQVVFLPFGISQASVTLNNVNLSLAVKSATNSTQFTIVYTVPSISASNATITPSNLSCQEPAGVE